MSQDGPDHSLARVPVAVPEVIPFCPQQAELMLGDPGCYGSDLPVILCSGQGCHYAYREDKAESILPSFRSPEFRDFCEHLHELRYVCVPEVLALLSLCGTGIPD
jgi:hypothetical protein